MVTARRVRAAAGLALAALLAASPASAAAAPADAPAREAALEQLRVGAAGPVRVGRHAGTGRIRTLKGPLSPPGEGSPAEVAAGFLRERASLFDLRPDLADLELEDSREAPGGTHLRFRQTLGGLPVFNGGVEVTLDRRSRVFLVTSRYVPAAAPEGAPALDAAAAAAAARGEVAAELAGEQRLGVFLDGETPRLAWRLVLESRAPFSVIEHTVDARDGRVLLSRDLVQRVYKNGRGRVFDPNPVAALNNRNLRDGADADSPAFAAAYRMVTLPALLYNGITKQYFLKGPYVSVTDAKESPFLFPSTRGVISTKSLTGTFNFGRAADQFEHVMVYYHIDRSQRYIQALGFTNVNRRRILADPHGLSDKNASHYVANPVGAGYLAFGSGGVDDAEDADVILHEYAHALQDNQAPGKYLGTTSEAAAMGEGFADYWAASSTYEQSVAGGFDPACVGEWNKVPGCMDRVDSPKRYPADKVGSAQADGQIWSAALWDLFQTTKDRGATDTLVLQSHFLVPANPTFADGVQALLDADELVYAGLHKAQICAVAAARGLPAAGCEFTATVTWDNPLVDLDLHLRPPDGADHDGWDYANDCYSQNRNPDWGTPGDASDDPLLKLDCRYTSGTGCHEEQIALTKFAAPGAYEVLVHYYDHSGWLDQPTTATVNVYRGGALLYSGSRLLNTTIDNLPDSGDLWKAFTLQVP